MELLPPRQRPRCNVIESDFFFYRLMPRPGKDESPSSRQLGSPGGSYGRSHFFRGITGLAGLRQRALDKAIAEINKKMDLNIALESLERSRHRWVSNDADFRDYAPSGNERRLVFPVTSLPNARSKLIPRVLRLYCFRNHRRSAGCRTGGSIARLGSYILSSEKSKRAQRQRGVMEQPPREHDLVDATRELYAPARS